MGEAKMAAAVYCYLHLTIWKKTGGKLSSYVEKSCALVEKLCI